MPATTNRLSFLPDFPGRDHLYYPLQTSRKEIRTITVLASAEHSAAIQCTLRTISIHRSTHTPHYHALSYYWGSTSDIENIIVHKESPNSTAFEVPVTRELASALRQFRARAIEKGEPLVLWTDAICINQLDGAERSQQVTIMRSVYEAASSVLIWLGGTDRLAEIGLTNFFGLAMLQQAGRPDSHATTNAFDYYDFDVKPDLGSLAPVNAIFQNFDKPGGYSFSSVNVKNLGAEMESWVATVSAMFNAPYWYRGWTVQEACANDHVSLYCGRARYRVTLWHYLRQFVSDNVRTLVWLASMRNVPSIQHLMYWLTTMDKSASAFTLVKRHQELQTNEESSAGFLAERLTSDLSSLSRSSRQTADPRDRVYGLIGSMVGFMLLKLQPDYKLSIEQVFTTTSVAILQGTQSWSHDQFFRPSASPFLPSWAIDFTSVPEDVENRISYDQMTAQFKADGDAIFRLQQPSPGRLHTAGFIHDEIVAVGPSGRQGGDVMMGKWLELMLSSESEEYLENNRSYQTWDDRSISFCRTLCLGTVKEEKFGTQHAAACENVWSDDELRDSNGTSILEKMLRIAHVDDEYRINFIVTRKGHIGLAPPDISIGDRIAILGGAFLPFALRQVDESYGDDHGYILIGGCYIDGESVYVGTSWSVTTDLRCAGIMYGEAVKERARSVFETKRRQGPVGLTRWIARHRKLISLDRKLHLKFSDKLAFLDNLCLL